MDQLNPQPKAAVREPRRFLTQPKQLWKSILNTNSDKPIIILLRQIMGAKRYAALYEIVVGISKYNINQESSRDMSDNEQRAWQLTIHHLEFLSKYGDTAPMVEISGRRWFAHPEEFSTWLELGAPGVSLDEIRTYLADFPI